MTRNPVREKNFLKPTSAAPRAGSSRYRGAASSRNPWAQSSRYRRAASSESAATGVALVLFWPAASMVEGNSANAQEVSQLEGTWTQSIRRILRRDAASNFVGSRADIPTRLLASMRLSLCCLPWIRRRRFHAGFHPNSASSSRPFAQDRNGSMRYTRRFPRVLAHRARAGAIADADGTRLEPLVKVGAKASAITPQSGLSNSG